MEVLVAAFHEAVAYVAWLARALEGTDPLTACLVGAAGAALLARFIGRNGTVAVGAGALCLLVGIAAGKDMQAREAARADPPEPPATAALASARLAVPLRR